MSGVGLRWARRQGDLLVAGERGNAEPLERLGRRIAPQLTPSFAVFGLGRTTLVVHSFAPSSLDNDVAASIADELVRPGLLGAGTFERCFAGVVTSTAASPIVAWRCFYANTLAALASEEPRPAGPIASFRTIYRHAAALVDGASVLDAGSCFGFFPLLLAERGALRVTASDREPATVALAGRIAAERRAPVELAVADVLRPLPFAPASFDTVTALHLLEHLPSAQTGAALRRLCAAARRRVVVAVPLEARPDPAFGHLQAFDLERLGALARGLRGWRAELAEHDGGWLVLDRAAPSGGRHTGVDGEQRTGQGAALGPAQPGQQGSDLFGLD